MKSTLGSAQFLLLAIAVSCADLASAGDGLGEDSFIEHLPMVLSVSRLPASRENTPAATTIIDRSLIKATGYREFSRLLRLVPGMQIGQERGNSHWVTYHGLGKDYPNQLQLLVDGVAMAPAGMSSFLNAMPQPLPMMDIERIEILRGSDFSTYGSGGFLGLINIVTRPTPQHSGVAVQLSGGVPSVADVTAGATLVLASGSLRMTAQSLNDKGFNGLKDQQHTRSVHLRHDVEPSSASRLALELWHTELERGMGYADTVFNSNGERDENQRLGGLRLRWTHEAEPGHLLRLSLQHGVKHNHERWVVSHPALSVPVENEGEYRWTAAEMLHTRPLSRSVTLAWGGELGYDVQKSRSLFFNDPRQTRSLGRLFGNIEWRVDPSWTINASAMVERISGQSPNAAPRLFLVWHERPGRTWRAGYTRAYHQPSVFEQRTDLRVLAQDGRELQLRLVPNPDIRAQRMDAFELGVFGQTRIGGTYDFRLFRERIKHLIRRMPVVAISTNPHPLFPVVQAEFGSSRWENSPDTLSLTGLEYELRSPRVGNARFMFSHSLIHAAHPDRQLERSVAPWTASLTWLHDWGQWHSSASLTARGKMDASTGFVPDHSGTVPAFTQLDISLWRRIHIGMRPAELRITGQNLLGRHQEIANAPLQRAQSGRRHNRSSATVFVSLTTEF